jgi:hypothetical protein
MAVALRQQRCTNHPQREASARCPSCGRFFCRECITEHDDRVLCASCLAKLAAREKERPAWWAWAPRLVLALAAATLIFLALLFFGSMLLSIPSKFHEQGGW